MLWKVEPKFTDVTEVTFVTAIHGLSINTFVTSCSGVYNVPLVIIGADVAAGTNEMASHGLNIPGAQSART